MGACTFMVREKGKSARAAFNLAVVEARYFEGSGGYTGTIAEKQHFVMIPLPKGREPEAYAYELIDNEDRRIDDNGGPAGCFLLKKGEEYNEYLFFGWARM